MRTRYARRVGALAATALVAVVTAGCVGGSAGSGSTSAPGTFATTGTATAHPTIPATGPLSKADYVAAMNAACRDTGRQLQALPHATSATDYAALHDYSQSVLTILPAFLAQATALTSRTADHAELTSKWISIEQADYAQISPILQQMVTSTQAENAAQVKSLEAFLDQAPDHSAQIVTFMNTYGLHDCATLESA